VKNYKERRLNPLEVLKSKSCFLLGPRQTGKSALIHHLLAPYKVYNLLESKTYIGLQKNPALIREELGPQDKIIVIDEIQRIPELLNEVHLMIEEHDIKFLLTGSSARKLKKKGVNLLAGRARTRNLHPFTAAELGDDFELLKALQIGLIPSIYFSDEPGEDLEGYVNTYLQLEISAEAVVRNLGVFSRFLEIAALSNGQMINYTEIASDTEVSATTIREYFQILEDTLIGHKLLPFKKTIKRKPIVTPKFYFFDTGVVNQLVGRTSVSEKTKEFGDLFETYIFHELLSFCSYNKSKKLTLHYWRSTSQHEVDFILNEKIAIEVKSKVNVTKRDLKGLIALREENICRDFFLVCRVPKIKTIDNIKIIPYQSFLELLPSLI
jgi:uncharacterized protein